jgi:hypothetical protein
MRSVGGWGERPGLVGAIPCEGKVRLPMVHGPGLVLTLCQWSLPPGLGQRGPVPKRRCCPEYCAALLLLADLVSAHKIPAGRRFSSAPLPVPGGQPVPAPSLSTSAGPVIEEISPHGRGQRCHVAQSITLVLRVAARREARSTLAPLVLLPFSTTALCPRLAVTSPSVLSSEMARLAVPVDTW